jgi:hypothetical protein
VGVAKRTLRVSRKEMEELFGLPEGVEILAVRPSRGFEGDDDFEFLLVSGEEVELNGHKVTVERKDGDFGLVRRIGLSTLRRLENGEEPYATGGYIGGKDVFVDNEKGKAELNININMEESKRNTNDVSKEIMKGLKSIMDKDKRKDGK